MKLILWLKNILVLIVSQIFQSKEDMSKHIDRIHGDSGILEGAK